MPRALAYVRVSSDGQADNTSLDVQADRVAAYATARGWTLDGTYSDVASGATLDRPGLSALRDALHPDDAVIVYRQPTLAVDRGRGAVDRNYSGKHVLTA